VLVSALWIASFLLTFTFPILIRQLGSAGTFWIYAAICLFGFFFVLASGCTPVSRTIAEALPI
jgi:hypothetical protein